MGGMVVSGEAKKLSDFIIGGGGLFRLSTDDIFHL